MTMNNDAIELGRLLDALKKRLPNLANRIRIWKNKLFGVRTRGQVQIRTEVFLMWELGLTEKHCVDCLRLNGQIHSASAWRGAGIQPQSPDLECGGWHCDCELIQMPSDYDGGESGEF